MAVETGNDFAKEIYWKAPTSLPSQPKPADSMIVTEIPSEVPPSIQADSEKPNPEPISQVTEQERQQLREAGIAQLTELAQTLSFFAQFRHNVPERPQDEGAALAFKTLSNREIQGKSIEYLHDSINKLIEEAKSADSKFDPSRGLTALFEVLQERLPLLEKIETQGWQSSANLERWATQVSTMESKQDLRRQAARTRFSSVYPQRYAINAIRNAPEIIKIAERYQQDEQARQQLREIEKLNPELASSVTESETQVNRVEAGATESSLEFKYEYMSDPEQRFLLAERVEQLIDRVIAENITNIVFLDKSARPISTLFLELWRIKHPDQPHPTINFVNVGTENSRAKDKYESDPIRLSDDVDTFAELSAKTGIPQQELLDFQARYARSLGSEAGSNIIVVDEYSSSGASLGLASKLIEVSYPQAQVQGTALSKGLDDPLFMVDPTRGYHDLPWRMVTQPGITGVVDADLDQQSENSLIAIPTRKMPGETRKQMQIEKEDRLFTWRLPQDVNTGFYLARRNLDYCQGYFDKIIYTGIYNTEANPSLNSSLADLAWSESGQRGGELAIDEVSENAATEVLGLLSGEIRKELEDLKSVFKTYESDLRQNLAVPEKGRNRTNFGAVAQITEAFVRKVRGSVGEILRQDDSKGAGQGERDRRQELVRGRVMPYLDNVANTRQLSVEQHDAALAILYDNNLKYFVDELNQLLNHQSFQKFINEAHRIMALEQGSPSQGVKEISQLRNEMRAIAQDYASGGLAQEVVALHED